MDEILQDQKTDWFKGYGFIHFQPCLMGLQLVKNSKRSTQKGHDNMAQANHHHELERFKIIKNNPVQDISILNTHDL